MRWLLPLWLIPTWLILWSAAPPAVAQAPPPAPEEAVAEEPPEDEDRITFAFQLSGVDGFNVVAEHEQERRQAEVDHVHRRQTPGLQFHRVDIRQNPPKHAAVHGRRNDTLNTLQPVSQLAISHVV